MKIFYLIISVFLITGLNAQSPYIFSYENYKQVYSSLKNSEKQEVLIKLEKIYVNSQEADSILRKSIVEFSLDSIINKDKVYSAFASKILLRSSRINEFDKDHNIRIKEIFDNGYCNIDLFQLAGCIGDSIFITPLLNIYKFPKSINKVESEVLINTLARLGHKKSIQAKLNSFNSIINTEDVTIKQELADKLRSINYINRPEFYDLLSSCIINNREKTVVVGSFGGDPFGGDDNIYCSLASFSLELLSEAIIDFPISKFNCSTLNKNSDTILAKSWLTENKNFKIKNWHPYYGFNYSYW